MRFGAVRGTNIHSDGVKGIKWEAKLKKRDKETERNLAAHAPLWLILKETFPHFTRSTGNGTLSFSRNDTGPR